jgi:hypothetical protein
VEPGTRGQTAILLDQISWFSAHKRGGRVGRLQTGFANGATGLAPEFWTVRHPGGLKSMFSTADENKTTSRGNEGMHFVTSGP